MNPQALSVVKVDTKNGVPALFFNINTDGPTYWQYLFGIPASPAPTDSKLKSIWTEVFWKPHKLYGPNGIEFPGETWDLSKEVGLRKRRQVWTHIKNLEAKVKDKIEREGRLVEQLKKAGAATPEPFLKYVAEMRKKGHQIESIYPPHVRATEQRYKSGGGLYKALLPDIREWLSKEKEWPSPLPWQDTGTFGVKKIPNFVADLKGGTTFGEVEGLKVTFLWSSGPDPMSTVRLTTVFHLLQIGHSAVHLPPGVSLPRNNPLLFSTNQYAFRNILLNRAHHTAGEKNREAVRRKLVELAQKYERQPSVR